MPLMPHPEVFGLHVNAEIKKDLQNGNTFFGALLDIHGFMTTAQKEADYMKTNLLLEHITNILHKVLEACRESIPKLLKILLSE